MNFTIAFIKNNSIDFTEILNKFLSPLLYHHIDKNTRINLMKKLNYELWNELEKYVTFANCDKSENLLELIHENIGKYIENDTKLITKHSFCNSYKFTEIIYSHKPDNNYNKTKVNEIGCLASLDHHFIQDTFSLITYEYDLDSDRYLRITNTCSSDLVRIIKRRFFNSACLVTDTKIDKLFFQKPNILCSRIFDDSVDKINYEIIDNSKYLLHCIHLPNNPYHTYINKVATRICRKLIIGPALFFSIYRIGNEKDSILYDNISIRELKYLNILSFGDLPETCDDTLNDIEETIIVPNEMKTEQKKIYPLWSKHVYKLHIKKEDLFMNDKCYSCNKKLENKSQYECIKCYGYRYCSQECLENKSHKCFVK